MQIDDSLPEWLKFLIATVLGAGGVSWLRVYLENRRLTKREFRETLLERIRELEKVVANMQRRMGNLRVEMAHLEVENQQLRRDQGCPEREDTHVDEADSGGEDVGEPS